MIRVVVLAAIPQESHPLLKLLGTSRKLAGQPFPTWLQRSSHLELLVMESGIGAERAWRAARHALSGSRIDLLVSVGFAGSLWPGFSLGQVVWSRELTAYYEGVGGLRKAGFRPVSTLGLSAFCQAQLIQASRFLTVDRLRPKAGMAARFAAEPAVVEMESTAVAAAAHGRNVPFLGLRAISDGSTQDIQWELDSVVDRDGRLSAPKLMLAVLRRPSLLRSLWRLRSNSRVAGRNLAAALMALLQLPEQDLLAIAEQLRLQPLPSGRDRGQTGAEVLADHA